MIYDGLTYSTNFNKLSEVDMAKEAIKGRSWNLNVECLLKVESLISSQLQRKIFLEE